MSKYFQIEEDNLRNLIFTTALNAEGSEDKKYEEVGSLDQLLKALTTIIETHNNTEQNPPITIVLFRYTVKTCLRDCQFIHVVPNQSYSQGQHDQISYLSNIVNNLN